MVHLRAIPPILLLILPLLGCATTPGNREKGPRPDLLWYERSVVTILSNEQLEDLENSGKLQKSQYTIIEPCEGGSCIRVEADRAAVLKEHNFPILYNPPFRMVEPDITRRKSSDLFFDWWNGYKDETLIWKILKRMASDFPELARLETLGTSLEGRPIYGLKISRNPHRDEDEPALLFLSATHGNEPLSLDYTLDTALILLLAQNPAKIPSDYPPMPELSDEALELLRRTVEKNEVWIVPLVNPDGLHYFWYNAANGGRKNRRDTYNPAVNSDMDGVDLNRNYPFKWGTGKLRSSSSNPSSVFYRGPSPASEPETRAIMSFARDKRFTMALSFHTYATKILVPYTIDGALSPYPSPAWDIGKTIALASDSARPDRDYIPVRKLYPVDGTDQDWMAHELGTMAFIVEGSYHTPHYFPYAKNSIAGLRQGILKSMEIAEEFPSLSLQVLDSRGQPRSVRVELLDVVHLENEIRQTDSKYGRFRTFLPGGGSYTILLGEGSEVSAHPVQCPDQGLCDIRIILP